MGSPISEEARPSVDGRWQWLHLLATSTIVVGLYVDGWSHGHVDRVGESVLTPWHWMLYGGYIASALILFRLVERHRIPGAGWRGASPPGYGYAVLVTFLFPTGAVLDLTWHQAFGVEVGIEGLISPTHLFMVSAMALMAGAPFRAWFIGRGVAPSGDRYATWRAVLSIMIVLAAIDFMTNFSQPLARQFGSQGSLDSVSYGVTSILFNSGVIAGALCALLQRRVALPIGSVTATVLIPAVGIGFMAGDMAFCVAVGLVGGIAGDAVMAVINRRTDAARLLILVPPATVAALWSAYWAVVALRHGITWIIHLWAGSIVMGTIAAAGVALLALRSGVPSPGTSTPAASETPRSPR